MKKELEKRILYNEIDDLAALEASLKVRDQYKEKGTLIDLLPSEEDSKDISLGRVRDLIAKNSGTTEYIDMAIDIFYPSVQRKLSLVSEQNAKPSERVVVQTYKNTLERTFAEFPEIKFEYNTSSNDWDKRLQAYKIFEEEIKIDKPKFSYFFEFLKTRQKPKKTETITHSAERLLANWSFNDLHNIIGTTFYDSMFLNLCSEQLLDLESHFKKFWNFEKVYVFPIEIWQESDKNN